MRMSFLPGPVAAAAASVVLAVLCGLYVLPLSVIVCFPGGPYPDTPDIRTGTAFFEKPAMVQVSIARDGAMYVAGQRVRTVVDVTPVLRELRKAHPDVSIEIRADRRIATSDVFRVLQAMRDAGFTEAYVFGHAHSMIDLNPR